MSPKVLLLDDEPAVRRFVDAVLEDLGVELRATTCIADALDELAAAPFALVLTDLMLAGESGRSLVERLHHDPALGQAPRVAVMSAGLSPQISTELLALGAWRLLHKPVSVAQLRQCVRDAIEAGPAAPQKPIEAPIQAPGPTPAPAGVVDTYFGGNERVYRAYRDACAQQFPLDLQEGDRACAQRDAVAVRRLGHTLKSVLLALGHVQAAETARLIDLAGQTSDWAAVQRHWPVLRTALAALVEDSAHPPMREK